MLQSLLQPLLHTFSAPLLYAILPGTADVHLGCTNHVPELFITEKLCLAERTLFKLRHGLVNIGVGEQFFGNLTCIFVNFGEVAQPQHLHTLLTETLGSKLGQLNKYKTQPLDNLARFGNFHYAVVVVIFVALGKCVVDKVQRIHWLQQIIVNPLVELADVGFRSIEQHTLLVGRSPHHLHLNDKLTTATVIAPHVHDAILAQWVIGHQLGVEVLHTLYFLLVLLEWKHGVKETGDKLGMLAKHFLERQVGFGVKVSSHNSVRINLHYKHTQKKPLIPTTPPQNTLFVCITRDYGA